MSGAILGAWGDSLIAGYNERKKSEREQRANNAHSYWRDKRIELYTDILYTAEDAFILLSHRVWLRDHRSASNKQRQ
ncbi:hypothetical protein HBB16_12310 [Pseudonocardia sp. MCCB 268]|nr:hypothetical protein [Pseudonocardia cytotoxica]